MSRTIRRCIYGDAAYTNRATIQAIAVVYERVARADLRQWKRVALKTANARPPEALDEVPAPSVRHRHRAIWEAA